MTTEASVVSCPKCNKRVAIRLADGSLEVRHSGNLLVTIYRGSVSCPRCLSHVESVEPDAVLPTFRTLPARES